MEYLITTTRRLGRGLRELGQPVQGCERRSATPEDLERWNEVNARYGYWMASPQENTEMGISLYRWLRHCRDPAYQKDRQIIARLAYAFRPQVSELLRKGLPGKHAFVKRFRRTRSFASRGCATPAACSDAPSGDGSA